MRPRTVRRRNAAPERSPPRKPWVYGNALRQPQRSARIDPIELPRTPLHPHHLFDHHEMIDTQTVHNSTHRLNETPQSEVPSPLPPVRFTQPSLFAITGHITPQTRAFL